MNGPEQGLAANDENWTHSSSIEKKNEKTKQNKTKNKIKNKKQTNKQKTKTKTITLKKMSGAYLGKNMTYFDDIWYVGGARSELRMLNFGSGRWLLST